MRNASLKRLVAKTLEDPSSAHFSLVNDFLAAATFVSILAIVLETVPALNPYHTWFLIIEWVTVLFFLGEYIARIYISDPKREYAFSFFGVTDLLAILPTFVGLGNFTFLKSVRIVRIMRFLRMVRLAKMSRLKVKDVEKTLGVLWFNIALYGAALVLVTLIVGTLLHVFVGTEFTPWSIPAGMYWAFAVFLGGLPAPVPDGRWGAFIFILTKFSGMALFGLLVRIVGEVFGKMILGGK